MRIAVHLGVLDEVELVESAVRRLFATGVDHVVANDLGSTDGSLDLLHSVAERMPDRLRVVQSGALLAGDLGGWPARALALVREARPDWALFLDADEFLVAASGVLSGTHGLDLADVLRVERFNVPLVAGDSTAAATVGDDPGAATLLLTAPIDDLAGRLARLPEMPWIRGVPVPKVMVRPERIGAVAIGGHDASDGEGPPLRRIRPRDLLIGHLPFTTRARFLRKVRNAQRTFCQNPALFTGHVGWHWRRWIDLLERGGLDAEFDRQVLSAADLATLRDDHVVESAREWFDRQASAA